MSDDDSGTLSINLPPITAQSRSISGERIETLKNLTAKYRVTVNSMTREGTEVSYTFSLPVGIAAKITVECLNSSGEVIVRAYKEHKVTGGDNSVFISLKNDGNEIINTGLYYSYGDAAAGGAVTGFPSSVKVGVGEKFTVTGTPDTITWDHGTFVEWKTNVALKGDADSGTSDVAAGDSVPVGTYIMPDGNVTLTAKWNEMTTLYVNSTGNDTTGDGSQAKPLATLNKAFTLINAMTGTTKEIKLASNISVNDTVTLDSVGKDVTLTSDNGTVRIVSLGLSLDRKNMISILNGNLTMTNITLDGQKDNGILITNNSSVIDVRGKSKLTLDNTTLQNFKVEYSSLRGFIEVTGAESSLMMQNKSKIQNNHFDMNGNGAATGSVNMSEGASFTMKSGTFIKDNSCTRTGQTGSFYGLGVYLLTGSSATVEDESGITNNTFTTNPAQDNKVYIVGNADNPITYNGVVRTQADQIR